METFLQTSQMGAPLHVVPDGKSTLNPPKPTMALSFSASRETSFNSPEAQFFFGCQAVDELQDPYRTGMNEVTL